MSQAIKREREVDRDLWHGAAALRSAGRRPRCGAGDQRDQVAHEGSAPASLSYPEEHVARLREPETRVRLDDVALNVVQIRRGARAIDHVASTTARDRSEAPARQVGAVSSLGRVRATKR